MDRFLWENSNCRKLAWCLAPNTEVRHGETSDSCLQPFNQFWDTMGKWSSTMINQEIFGHIRAPCFQFKRLPGWIMQQNISAKMEPPVHTSQLRCPPGHWTILCRYIPQKWSLRDQNCLFSEKNWNKPTSKSHRCRIRKLAIGIGFPLLGFSVVQLNNRLGSRNSIKMTPQILLIISHAFWRTTI
jgi:hypothetical protein